MSGDLAIPTIGITLSPRADDRTQQRKAARVTQAYRLPLEILGAKIIELVAGESQPTLDGLDGLLLSGGGDIAPDLYNQPPHPKLGRVERVRDEFELALVPLALAQGIPILGICRGAQVLGVALGGDLIQDIPSQVQSALEHQADGKVPARHILQIAENSLLANITGRKAMLVNSYHHQSNSSLDSGLRPVAWSQDGVIEAIELPGQDFVLGVQWHPERMWRHTPRQAKLFQAFVSAAVARKSRKKDI